MQNLNTTLIISTYNWIEALQLCLQSVANQTILPNEVIIADDGSRNDTAERIDELRKTFPCPLIHVWHEDRGFYKCEILNKAIQKASGEYIIQIDGDIILEKHFIHDHLQFARKGCFVAGSRVLLNKELSEQLLTDKKHTINFFTKGIRNPLNTLRIAFLRNYFRFRYKAHKPYYAKGCNMAFWKKDVIAVNGYNEDMIGWGYEDSEIVARLIHSGVKRQFIKFAAVQYHIFHQLFDRDREPINWNIFQKAVAEKTKWCENGIDKNGIEKK
ncbi:MAG: glycosyltransferase family 2 protein [Bacteroidetes bacterium]|nr:glycosyltransferase family 2 protein [Bacteroidota bacterium]